MFELIKKVDQECGTPFYFVYPDRFVNNLQSFRKAFTDIYPNFILSYSFKTNYSSVLLQRAKECDCFAETVSSMEYNLAIQKGFPKDKIIFNGPIKSFDDIKTALQNKSILQLDSEYEVDHVLKLREENPDQEIRVGLRINMEVGSGNIALQGGLRQSRFGFTNEMLQKVVPLLKEARVAIISLHGHTSSSDRVVANYQRISARLMEVRRDFELNDIKYVNVGGGFFGAAPEGIDVSSKPKYTDYAKGICDILLADGWFKENKPCIVIEPGASVVSNVFELVTKIHQRKNIQGQDFVFADASYFQIRPFLNKMNLPFCEYSDKPKEDEIIADVVGATCMEVDKIAEGIKLRHYTHGDYLLFKAVGGYRQNLSPMFIIPWSPVVEITPEKNVKVWKNRQDASDLLNMLER
ncbi:MAG: hypothetical protein MJY85_03720 [Fibrobacter sp.]|nr:hypothetical protein [Fibrobacter sp.]